MYEVRARRDHSPRDSGARDSRVRPIAVLRPVMSGSAVSVLVAIGLLVTGCGPRKADVLHFLREHEHEVSAIEYRVGIPDGIAINAPRIPEIDQESQRIQPDGKINLKLLGEVKVVGMTAKEIAAKLEILLSRYYVDPKVSVRVADYNSKKFYIYGQVGSPGAKTYTGRDTLVDAIARSGADFLSWTSNVKVIRPAHDGAPVRTMTVNVDQMMKTGDWSRNVLLEPDDVVYIPPTPLAWVGLRVREVLYPVGPAMQAYTTPADVKEANDEYNEDDNNNNG